MISSLERSELLTRKKFAQSDVACFANPCNTYQGEGVSFFKDKIVDGIIV